MKINVSQPLIKVMVRLQMPVMLGIVFCVCCSHKLAIEVTGEWLVIIDAVTIMWSPCNVQSHEYKLHKFSIHFVGEKNPYNDKYPVSIIQTVLIVQLIMSN